MKIGRKPEPVSVAMGWDDLWLVVKCQPSSEIAGSPRKVYRDRDPHKFYCGRAPNGRQRVTNDYQSNSEYNETKVG